MSKQANNPPINKSNSWRMFDEISARYDLLNHLLSFGLDIRWRIKLAEYMPSRHSLRVLDLATGTADVLIALVENNKNVSDGSGLDMATKMLAIGQEKIKKKGLSNKISLLHGDAQNIPMANGAFDAVTIAFGIRNMPDPTRVLQEMRRVLNARGRCVVLEFSLPENLIIRFIHQLYLRYIVPIIGWVLTGHLQAYRYLNKTIETFPYGQDFCRLMTDAGFKNVRANPLMWGTATIYQGDNL